VAVKGKGGLFRSSSSSSPTSPIVAGLAVGISNNDGSVNRPDTPKDGCDCRQDRVGTGNVSVFGALLRCVKNRVDGGGLVREA
jgi:hypothetical protein